MFKVKGSSFNKIEQRTDDLLKIWRLNKLSWPNFTKDNFVAAVLRVGTLTYIKSVEEIAQLLNALDVFLRLQNSDTLFRFETRAH